MAWMPLKLSTFFFRPHGASGMLGESLVVTMIKEKKQKKNLFPR
jgi:hypothetical protein